MEMSSWLWNLTCGVSYLKCWKTASGTNAICQLSLFYQMFKSVPMMCAHSFALLQGVDKIYALTEVGLFSISQIHKHTRTHA